MKFSGPRQFYRSLNVNGKLFFSYLWVILGAVVAMGAAAIFSLNTYRERNIQDLNQSQLSRIAGSISYNLKLSSRLSDILFTDMVVNRALAQRYAGALEVWRAYIQQGLADHLRQFRVINPEILSMSFFVTNPTLLRYENFIVPIASMTEIPNPEPGPLGATITYRFDLPKDSSQPKVLIMERLLYNLGEDQTVLLPMGVLRLGVNTQRIFDTGNLLYSHDSVIWTEDASGTVVNGTRPPLSELKRGALLQESIQTPGWVVHAFVPRANPFEGLSDSIPVMLLVAVLSLGILATASQLVSRNFTRRIQRQLNHALQIASGNFDSKIGDPSGDEISRLSASLDALSGRLKQLIDENIERGVSLKAAEMTALQAQINPHMLYNTLATVYWMARDIEAHDIAEVTDSLVKFFRYSLNKGKEMIRVSDEIEQIHAYLRIQQYRFKDSAFTYEVRVDPGAEDQMIPKLILQPFVENAILHGMENLGRPGHIRIEGAVDRKILRLSVQDNGVGIETDALNQPANRGATSGGFGIFNVRERLRLHYGTGATCRVAAGDTGGTRVVVELPARV